MPALTISGQSGKTLNATVRDCATVGMLSPVLSLQSLDVDTLSWTQVDGIVADDLQTVNFYIDGVRAFSGIITQRRYRYGPDGVSYQMVASGGLYLASMAQIVDSEAAVSSSSDPGASIQFPSGSLTAMVTRLVGLMPGIEMATGGGAMDATWSTTRQTFTGGTFLGCLMDLLKPVADVAGWVDYSVSGTPQLHIERRGAMSALTLELGTDAVSSVDLAARKELQLTGVSLALANRAANGKVVYSRQTAGTSPQIVHVTGPQVGAFVPPDDIPSYRIKTGAAYPAQRDPALAAVLKTYGSVPGGIGTRVTTYAGSYPPTSGAPWYPVYRDFPELAYSNEAGQAVDVTGKYLITSLDVPAWVIEEKAAVKVTVTGTWIDYEVTPTSGWSPQFTAMQGGAAWGQGRDVDYNSVAWLARPFEFEMLLISTAYTARTTIYPAKAYEYLTAPAGMAAGMLAAANFIPYEGSVGLTPDFPYQRFLGKKLNVSGGDANLETAGALIQGMTLDLQSGVVTLKCGAPARMSLHNALGRYVSSTKDNIFLT